MQRFRVAIVSTGGTIEKTYCAQNGALLNEASVLDVLLAGLEMPGLDIVRRSILNMDSLEMTSEHHCTIVEEVENLLEDHDGIVVVHGTDRLARTGELIYERLLGSGQLTRPVVLTGAMRPYELRTSDASQNVTEALLAVQLLDPGVYCVMHGCVLPFPGVVKDSERGTFVRSHV